MSASPQNSKAIPKADASAVSKRKLTIHAKKAIEALKGGFDLRTIKRDLSTRLGVDSKEFDVELKEFLTTSIQAGDLKRAEGKYRAVPRRRKSSGKRKKRSSGGKRKRRSKKSAAGAGSTPKRRRSRRRKA